MSCRLLFSVLLCFTLFCGCKSEPSDNPDGGALVDQRKEAFKSLNAEFEANTLLVDFAAKSDNIYTVKFSTGRVVELNKSGLSLSVCTPTTWPTIKISNGRWLVNGADVGVVKAETNTTVVAVVYDKEGLYVWLESGKIIFFHTDSARQIGCFRFCSSHNVPLAKDIVCLVDGDNIAALIPAGFSNPNLVATVAYRGKSLKIGEQVQQSSVSSNNFASKVVYTIEAKDGVTSEFTVDVMGFKRIPVLKIVTNGGAPIVSKDDYLKANLIIEDPDMIYSQTENQTLLTEIRGRGNSTWGMPKKPYKIKLDKKSALLGMTTDKEWALLANYSDKTSLRNTIAFDISRRLGMSFTPDMRPVEVYLNNDYQGVYMLCEQVKVSSERVDIELVGKSDNEGEAVTGGYFLEIDERLDADVYFHTSRGLAITFKDPKIPTNQQLAYVKKYFNDAEGALFAPNFTDPVNGYAKYIDVKSFVDNYIIQELTKNVDGNMRLSGFLIKPRAGKIAHSNVWDFDIALGNCNYLTDNQGVTNDYKGFFVKLHADWYKQLFKDPAFVTQVKNSWNALYPQIANSSQKAEMLSVMIDGPQSRNFAKWRILDQLVWPNIVATGSYRGEVTYLQDFLVQRAEWLNGELNKL